MTGGQLLDPSNWKLLFPYKQSIVLSYLGLLYSTWIGVYVFDAKVGVLSYSPSSGINVY